MRHIGVVGWTALVAGIVVIVVVALVVAGSERGPGPGVADRWNDLGAVARLATKADHNQAVVMRCGEFVFRARFNLDVIRLAADYVARIPDGTPAFVAIARAAAEAEAECPELRELLDLAVRRRSETATIVALARDACDQRPDAVAARRRKLLAELAATAEYSTTAEALAARAPRN